VTLCTGSGSLPVHQYVWADLAVMTEGGQSGYVPAVWFGLHAHPARAWGCHVMLECGAVYRGLPPHALAFLAEPPDWTIGQAQLWDCYGRSFSTLVYDYLYGLDAVARVCGEDVACSYLFTAVPVGDAFTEAPEQAKEFMFLRTDHGRLTIQPTNRVRFIEKSFTDPAADWPTHLRRQSEVWTSE
jgi:hypothetical protein